MKKTGLTLLALIFAAPALAAPLPQSADLTYSGSYGIPATMTFTLNGSRYKVVSNIKVPLYRIRFESAGRFSDGRLSPAYYKDVRGGKLYAEAKFGNGSVTYGKAGEETTENIRRPVMDLFTLAWQLAAGDGRLPAGLSVTNGKKIYSVGGLDKTGSGKQKIGKHTVAVNKYRLRNDHSTVNYAFAPDLDNIPTRISYTDNGKTYDLKLIRAKINGRSVPFKATEKQDPPPEEAGSQTQAQ